MPRWIVLVVLFLSLTFSGIGMPFADETHPRVKLTTSMGDIVLDLDRTAAPKTVANFLSYVKSGHYDGTIFHRVIAGFMIQGGGFTADMQRKPTRAPIRNEADNGLSNRTGTIAMARTNDPHSASAQFFINVKDNDFLDHRAKSTKGWGYCVFGRVVDGMNVVRAIENAATTSRSGMRDVPRTTVTIKQATLITD